MYQIQMQRSSEPASKHGSNKQNQQAPFKMRPLYAVVTLLIAQLALAGGQCHFGISIQQDKRPVQIYPWQNVTVVGTTDVEHHDDMSIKSPASVKQEFNYLMYLPRLDHQFPAAKITQARYYFHLFRRIRPVIASRRRFA